MADEEEEIIVICSPWDQKRVPSVSVACRGCGRLLAMSRSVRKELPTAVAECAKCSKDTGEPILMPTSARKEVIARLGFDPGREAPSSLKDWLRSQGG